MLAAVLLLCAPGVPQALQAEDAAKEALAAGRVAQALVDYERAIRAAGSTHEKERLRDAYLAAGWAPPPAINLAERAILHRHVLDERVRVYRKAADRLEREGKLHAALAVAKVTERLLGGGSGAAGDRARVHRLLERLTERPDKAQKAKADAIVKSGKSPADLLAQARTLLAAKEYPVADRVCQAVQYGDGSQKEKDAAQSLRKEVAATAEEDLPPKERAAALAVLEDPRFDRLDVVASRHFLFLGPRDFVRSIPERQRTLLDLAYIFQSDLTDQLLTVDGRRICVYYQETFDFGGGLAGGKLIRIGCRAIRLPVAGFLHYHELGHCIFGRGWLHPGFTEGLADFAAGFSLDMLGATKESEDFITSARLDFVRFYLGRSVRYLDIEPYKPAAGFLFSFLPPGEAPFDWQPYRKVFHLLREAQFGSWPVRQYDIMRHFGSLLAAVYGPGVFERLRRWGWPVSPKDASLVPQESQELLPQVKQAELAFDRGENPTAESLFRGILEKEKEGALAARARYGLLRLAVRRGGADAAETLRRRLGIVDAYEVLGAYHAHGRTAYVVFPPEEGRIDRTKPVTVGLETGVWKKGIVAPDGYLDLLKQGFGYPEHACAFALCYVHAAKREAARVWIGSDDGYALYWNGRLVDKRPQNRSFRVDDDFYDVALASGWNRLMVKVSNDRGPWGALLRVTAPDGRPLEGLRFSADDHEAEVAHAGKRRRFKPFLVDDFRQVSHARWKTTVGSFTARNGLLQPHGTANKAKWNRFVVDPDKKPSGPANLIWLLSPALAHERSFRMTLALPASGKDGLPAKFAVTIDGEGGGDGQSGHTLVFQPSGRKLACRWYRYTKLLYEEPGKEIPAAAKYELVLQRVASRWRVALNGVSLFQDVDAAPLPAFRIGLATWGKAPAFDAFRLDLPAGG